jgi:hypothetical protein
MPHFLEALTGKAEHKFPINADRMKVVALLQWQAVDEDVAPTVL